jgi:hypothetical protein
MLSRPNPPARPESTDTAPKPFPSSVIVRENGRAVRTTSIRDALPCRTALRTASVVIRTSASPCWALTWTAGSSSVCTLTS